ncbi:hypothetical protein AUP74_02904 [Microbulbifer aggregans]|uniref:Copper resistance protein D n=1 Tax=Microbulbifer aggregans TaxID=1769779 RepID=A0A1C9WAU3_9GAMM|nr:hypothetical protein [Microbulbifer aggregans]AOS98275.1 hypothetical protein AUP74_02904 [Microbulbifer aggregans]
MSAYLFVKLLHNLCFVYWLGGDLGTFYASRYVTRSDLSPQARSTALTIMMGCDQGPRFCMPLILPLGLQLAHMTGQFSVAPVWLGVAWVFCLGWLALVATLHFAQGKSFVPALTRFDFYLRVVLIIGLLALAGYALATNFILAADWLAIKLGIFALLVLCGLIIRMRLKLFGSAWGELMSGNDSASVNQTIRSSIASCRPFVFLIWVGLLANAAYGLHLIN